MRQEPKASNEINRRIAELLPRTCYMHMKSQQEKEDLFRLRYEAYLRENAILPNDSGKWQDKFDDLENTFNIGVYVEQRLVGAMRICVWSKQFSYHITPGVEGFGEDLTPYLTEDTVLIDPNRFVMDTPFTRSEIALSFLAMRIWFMACIKFNATISIAGTRREHCRFYMRSFGYKQVIEPRLYPGLIKPFALLIQDFPVNRQPIIDKYPSFAPLDDDLEEIFSIAAAKQDN